MKLKILATGIILMMIFCTLLSSGKTNNNDQKTANDEIKEIRVAIYSMGEVIWSDKQKYFEIFDGYQWQVGDNIYRFTLTAIDDKGILKGELNTKNFDVFTIAWMEATQMTMKLSRPSIKNIIWKSRIADFIKQGGGYFGSCSGAIIMVSGLSNRPETIYEKMMDKGSLHISKVKSYFQGGYIFLAQLSGHPEKIGQVAYVWFSGWDENNKSANLGGCCLDVVVDKNNPIFNDVCGDTRLIRWVGGPAFVLPDQSNNVIVISYYPSKEISDNKSTQIHAWKYSGRLLGILRGFLSTIKMGGNIFNKLYYTPFKATDWDKTETKIQTHLADKPFMTIETYPNDNQGRIVLCGGHPEDAVWWGGQIEESNDYSKNNLFDSLYHWTNVTEVDNTYNWCIFRREAAWAGKIPDNDFPPIYGASQVSNIFPYNQSSTFTINGNTKLEEFNVISLDLYYRYSNDNTSWSDWTLYETDSDSYNGFSWEFNAPNSSGYYEFYSIRHVKYDEFTETETAPPGPDAISYVE